MIGVYNCFLPSIIYNEGMIVGCAYISACVIAGATERVSVEIYTHEFKTKAAKAASVV
jgi:hypothetical protein